MENLIYEGAELDNFKILSLSIAGQANWHKRWNVECKHCGRLLEKSSNDIKRQKSCGCLKKLNADTPLDTRYKRLVKAHLKYEGTVISKEEFRLLSNSNCYYCDTPPSNEEKGETYSGIDRTDSLLGYISSNVNSCCWICNRMKNNLTKLEFLNHMSKILKRFEAGKLKV